MAKETLTDKDSFENWYLHLGRAQACFPNTHTFLVSKLTFFTANFVCLFLPQHHKKWSQNIIRTPRLSVSIAHIQTILTKHSKTLKNAIAYAEICEFLQNMRNMLQSHDRYKPVSLNIVTMQQLLQLTLHANKDAKLPTAP